jgi:hypothetical protein
MYKLLCKICPAPDEFSRASIWFDEPTSDSQSELLEAVIKHPRQSIWQPQFRGHWSLEEGPKELFQLPQPKNAKYVNFNFVQN